MRINRIALLVVAAGGLALSACGDDASKSPSNGGSVTTVTPTTVDAMSGDKMTETTIDAMSGDKMTDDKMSGDKMTETTIDAMSGDKMTEPSTTGA